VPHLIHTVAWTKPLSRDIIDASGVLERSGQRVPQQSYPNPFNPHSHIRYQISEFSNVRLVVYALLGREVAVLVDERKEPGRHEVTFDGSGLSSGVYLCRLMTGQFIESRKMILAK
jgi:hypothetical protein